MSFYHTYQTYLILHCKNYTSLTIIYYFKMLFSARAFNN
nr:MAG TPA: hypothetical protein [Caudoviricetes sp.]